METHTLFVNILIVVTKLKRLLENVFMSVHRKEWHNDITSVVTNGSVV